MINSFRHLRYLFWHKFYVFQAGLKWKVPIWQLIIHDFSKLRPSEFIPYTRHFFEAPGTSTWHRGLDSPTHAGFVVACNLHYRRNAHHPEYWCAWSVDKSWHDPQEMPERYAREMLADWDGTGMSKTGKNNTVEYYRAQRDKFVLHPNTRRWIEHQLGLSQ